MGPQRSLILAVIIGRMAHLGSERATRRWLEQRSGLGELLEVDFEAMGENALYRAADGLMQHRSAIEVALFHRVNDLFGLEFEFRRDAQLATMPKTLRRGEYPVAHQVKTRRRSRHHFAEPRQPQAEGQGQKRR